MRQNATADPNPNPNPTTAGKPRRGRKRGAGEGSIYQRADGLWVASLMVGRKADGKPDRRVVYGKTRADVVRKLDDLRRRVSGGLVTEPHRLTVSEHLTQWLRDSVTPTSRPKTIQTYECLIRGHILPQLGNLKLTALKPAHVQALYATMLAAGLSHATVRLTHAVLSRALSQAVDFGYLARNVADAVDQPAPERREMRPLTAKEARELIAYTEDRRERLAPLWRLLIDSGARVGEALSLTWPDVELDRGTISVRRTLVSVDTYGTPAYGPPETARSVRTVTLTPDTVSVLKAHRARQAAERLKAGGDYATHDLVFSTPIGTALGPKNMNGRLTRTLARAGLPRVRVHDLRHTAATLMLMAGVNPRVAADRLGHANVSITLDRYSHVLQSMEQDAAAKLARVLSG